MAAVLGVIVTLIVSGQSRSSPLFVTYVDTPTCGVAQDAAWYVHIARARIF